jgi:hypothetical protein
MREWGKLNGMPSMSDNSQLGEEKKNMVASTMHVHHHSFFNVVLIETLCKYCVYVCFRFVFHCPPENEPTATVIRVL